MASTTSTTTHGGISETVKQGAHYISESAKELGSKTSKEGNKEVAKGHTDAPLSTRASAGVDAVGDKFKEEGHSGKADAHKEAAKH